MSSNNEIDILKKLFSCSSEYVVIMDYNFEIIWCSKEEISGFLNSVNFLNIFENLKKPLKSGEYFLKFNEMEIPCSIINYSESGIYVLQTSGEDVMSASLRSDALRHFFSNQAGQLRENVSGISAAVSLIRDTLDDEELEQINRFLDLAAGKCRGILKAVLHPEELIKYIENTPEPSVIELKSFLEKFSEICRKILKKQIELNLSADPDIYIYANPDRFTVCMLSLTVLTGKNIPDCGQIFITAGRKGNDVYITVSSGTSKNDNEEKLFSRFEKLYKDEASDPDLFVVHRFCRACGGMFLIADNAKNNGKIYSVRLPFFRNLNRNVTFTTEPTPYRGEQFSIYSIALSEIADII